MDRNEIARRVELGIMTLLVTGLGVLFAINYDPNSKKIVDDYVNGKRGSSSVAVEVSSVKKDLPEESSSSEKSDNMAESSNYAVNSELASNLSSKPETPTEPPVDKESAAVVDTPRTDLININHADLEQLQQLDGIGKVRAQAIIDYRESHGMFQTVEELINVDGIGEKTLEKNLGRITV